ncbi:MAG: hypothetical protein GEV06_09045 [Luteitalea sp.]|nr:hypothetical protein [Luteitalea sp.]
MRSLSAIAIGMMVLGTTACSDDDESPTAPADTGIAGDYRLAIRASGTCSPDLDAGRIQEFDATITQSGTDVAVTLSSRQGLPTEGAFEGILDGSTMHVEGTVNVVPDGSRSYEASGTLIGSVATAGINGLFEGTIRYGDAACSALNHDFGFVRD